MVFRTAAPACHYLVVTGPDAAVLLSVAGADVVETRRSGGNAPPSDASLDHPATGDGFDQPSLDAQAFQLVVRVSKSAGPTRRLIDR